MGHELYHAYQDDINERFLLTSNEAETQAVYFQNYLTSVFGYGDMRTRYGRRFISFSSDEAEYNPENEKITNFSIRRNPLSKPPEPKSYYDGHSDGYAKKPIVTGTPSFSISYEKSYTVDGKEIKQSIKKANELKLANEN